MYTHSLDRSHLLVYLIIGQVNEQSRLLSLCRVLYIGTGLFTQRSGQRSEQRSEHLFPFTKTTECGALGKSSLPSPLIVLAHKRDSLIAMEKRWRSIPLGHSYISFSFFPFPFFSVLGFDVLRSSDVMYMHWQNHLP